jgi:hypothetical protein
MWTGTASAGPRSQGAASDGAIRAACGRFRPERSFPAGDGDGLSWSPAAGNDAPNDDAGECAEGRWKIEFGVRIRHSPSFEQLRM